MKKNVLIVVLVLLLAGFAGGFVYIGDYYHASESALAVLRQLVSDEPDVTVLEQEGMAAFLPADMESIENGIIFYPGGKVEPGAYAALLYHCAELGVASVLVSMPGNLAVLDVNAADGIVEQYPQVQNWYLAGHSLGGAMASSYLAAHMEDYEGLILLAAYSTEPLQGKRVLSVYGTEDGVLDLKKYEACKVNLPPDYTEVIIEGGCHAYFGTYGSQEGDGVPTIRVEEQIERTAHAIAEFVSVSR